MYYENEDRFEGEFKNNVREGKGIYYYLNGDIEIGDYMNNIKKGIHYTIINKGKIVYKQY